MTAEKVPHADALHAVLSDLFPDHSERLYSLCLRGSSAPLGIAHPRILLQLASPAGGAEDFADGDVFENVAVGYMLICAYYFLLDAAVDGHLEFPDDPVYLTLLLTAAVLCLAKALGVTEEGRVAAIIGRSVLRVSQNASASLLERKASVAAREEQSVIDRECIIGRSNSFLLLYEILCALTGTAIDPDIVTLLEDFIVTIQEADDLADWREDFQEGRLTPFLRRVFFDIGAGRSESELEEHLYLTGIYEKKIAELVHQVDATRARAERLGAGRAAGLVRLLDDYRESLIVGLREITKTKLDAYAAVPEVGVVGQAAVPEVGVAGQAAVPGAGAGA
jgi:hypothetical protein